MMPKYKKTRIDCSDQAVFQVFFKEMKKRKNNMDFLDIWSKKHKWFDYW